MDTSLHESIKMVGNEQLDAIVHDVIGSMAAMDRTPDQQQKYEHQTRHKSAMYGETIHPSQRAEIFAVESQQWTFKELFSIILSQAWCTGRHNGTFRLTSYVSNSELQNGADDMLHTRKLFSPSFSEEQKCMDVTDALYIVWLGRLVHDKALYHRMNVHGTHNQHIQNYDVLVLARMLSETFEDMITGVRGHNGLPLDVHLNVLTANPWVNKGQFGPEVMQNGRLIRQFPSVKVIEMSYTY